MFNVFDLHLSHLIVVIIYNKNVSTAAVLLFPVGRIAIAKHLRERKYAKRLGVGAAIFLTSIIKHVTAELLVQQRIIKDVV